MKVRSYEDLIQERRLILKSISIERDEWESHQRKGVAPPPLEKPYRKDADLVDLPSPSDIDLGNVPLARVVKQRKSRREYTSEALKLEELSFLLWATQGVKAIDTNKVWTRRTVPSAGARHPFETYLVVSRVTGLEAGVYRYLPIEHKLLLVDNNAPIPDRISRACKGQTFVGEAAVVFIWATIPYRAEWRYSVIAYKGILVDIGHVCRNLYLACEAIGVSTCAILAYDQELVDALIGVDGKDEFAIYIAPAGRATIDRD